MPRFAFTVFLLLLVVGCQTPGRSPQKTVLVHSSPPTTPAKTFWMRTAQFLQPLMPDRNHRTVETGNHLAAHREHSDILPISHSPYSLYRPGSIFPSPSLVRQDQIAGSVTNVPEHPNPLQIQLQIESGDTEAFKLPESTRAAPPPMMELASTMERAEIRRAADAALRNRDSYWDDDDFHYDEPVVRQVARRTLPSNDEAVVAQSSMPMTGPVYPSLTQLPGAAPAVVQAGYHSQSVVPQSSNMTGHGAGDWRAPTRVAVEQLRYAIEQTPNGRTETNETRLRMLEMLLGNRTEAARPIPSADNAYNRFLGHQVLGWADLLDDSMQNSRSRHVSAVYRFGEGLQELQNLSPIKLKNVMFIEDWLAFGQYIPRPTQEFYPGDEFFVYMEIDNPTVRRIPDGYEVGVSLSYEIRDAHAVVVFRQDLPPSGERSLSRKRDYALRVPGTLPPSLAPGQYQLRISITDLHDDSMQHAEEQIPFRVLPSLATGR